MHRSRTSWASRPRTPSCARSTPETRSRPSSRATVLRSSPSARRAGTRLCRARRSRLSTRRRQRVLARVRPRLPPRHEDVMLTACLTILQPIRLTPTRPPAASLRHLDLGGAYRFESPRPRIGPLGRLRRSWRQVEGVVRLGHPPPRGRARRGRRCLARGCRQRVRRQQPAGRSNRQGRRTAALRRRRN